MFISFLKDTSDQKILSNKSYIMLNRLEKALIANQKVHFNDFNKFICQPEHLKYNDAFNEFK